MRGASPNPRRLHRQRSIEQRTRREMKNPSANRRAGDGRTPEFGRPQRLRRLQVTSTEKVYPPKHKSESSQGESMSVRSKLDCQVYGQDVFVKTIRGKMPHLRKPCVACREGSVPLLEGRKKFLSTLLTLPLGQGVDWRCCLTGRQNEHTGEGPERGKK